MAPPEELLVLDYEGLSSRSQSFFDALGESDELVAEFLDEPVRVLSERVLTMPEAPESVEIAKANRFLFSLLSNEGFMRWAERWQEEHRSAISTSGEGEDARMEVKIDREELYRDLAKAIWEYGDREMLSSLIGLDLEDPARERELTAEEGPEELLAEESQLRLPPLPKPVNFNVTVNVTVNYSVAAAAVAVLLAVFVIPVAVIGLVEPEIAGREDLQRLAGHLTQELRSHADELRESGELSP